MPLESKLMPASGWWEIKPPYRPTMLQYLRMRLCTSISTDVNTVHRFYIALLTTGRFPHE